MAKPSFIGNRFLALSLATALSLPSPVFALREQNVTEKDRKVQAGLEAALRDPADTARGLVQLAETTLFPATTAAPSTPQPSPALPAAGLEGVEVIAGPLKGPRAVIHWFQTKSDSLWNREEVDPTAVRFEFGAGRGGQWVSLTELSTFTPMEVLLSEKARPGDDYWIYLRPGMKPMQVDQKEKKVSLAPIKEIVVSAEGPAAGLEGIAGSETWHNSVDIMEVSVVLHSLARAISWGGVLEQVSAFSVQQIEELFENYRAAGFPRLEEPIRERLPDPSKRAIILTHLPDLILATSNASPGGFPDFPKGMALANRIDFLATAATELWILQSAGRITAETSPDGNLAALLLTIDVDRDARIVELATAIDADVANRLDREGFYDGSPMAIPPETQRAMATYLIEKFIQKQPHAPAAGLEGQRQAGDAALDVMAQRFQGAVSEIFRGLNLDSSALDLGSVPADARGVIVETAIGDVLPLAMALDKRKVPVVVVERDDSSLQVTTALLNGTGIPVVKSFNEALTILARFEVPVTSPIILTPINASNVQAAIQLLLEKGFLLQGDLEPLLAAGMEEARSRQEIERYYQ